jgi:hypothetical protein
MKKRAVFKRGPLAVLREALGAILFTLAIVAMIAAGLVQTAESNRAEGLRLLEESIRRAAVECYALEGSYPESLEYIEEHYGVLVDRNRYFVHYDLPMSNFMPEITVLDLRGET